MKMVITLKSGLQIKADVESFSTGEGRLDGDLRSLKWVTTDRPEVKINWLDINEVAAVHAEYDRSKEAENDGEPVAEIEGATEDGGRGH